MLAGFYHRPRSRYASCGGVHINCPFAEPLYGEMDDTGLSWQQRLGDWWQDDKPWLREAPRLESEKQRDWFFWRQKARRGGCRAHECGRGQKLPCGRKLLAGR